MRLNALIVQVRPCGDALYKSDYFPWSKYVTGRVGQEPDFDPLTVMLEETHARGISFHGWLNPMRIQARGTDISRVSRDYLIGQWYNCEDARGTYIVEHDGNWFLNPAYDAVVELIARGTEEIARRYNIDGLHIDDYFYPTVNSSFDTAAFADSSQSELREFRVGNINRMVRAMFDATKRGNPNAQFGISPAGGIENNMNRLFADVELWSRNVGFADYIVPQIYFGFEHDTLPFAETALRWQELADNSPIRLLIGLAMYKSGREDSLAGSDAARREWQSTESAIIRRQIEFSRTLPNYGGVVFFSYNFLFSPTHMNAAIRAEIEEFRSIL
jgi:uncharacterized lipoprotein YddW (UPF0748 family)